MENANITAIADAVRNMVRARKKLREAGQMNLADKLQKLIDAANQLVNI